MLNPNLLSQELMDSFLITDSNGEIITQPHQSLRRFCKGLTDTIKSGRVTLPSVTGMPPTQITALNGTLSGMDKNILYNSILNGIYHNPSNLTKQTANEFSQNCINYLQSNIVINLSPPSISGVIVPFPTGGGGNVVNIMTPMPATPSISGITGIGWALALNVESSSLERMKLQWEICINHIKQNIKVLFTPGKIPNSVFAGSGPMVPVIGVNGELL